MITCLLLKESCVRLKNTTTKIKKNQTKSIHRAIYLYDLSQDFDQRQVIEDQQIIYL